MATTNSFLQSPDKFSGSYPGLAQQLPQIATETELQKMLADERMRSQMHRTHYEQLKTEHHKLQDEYGKLEEEIKHTIEESRIVQEKYKLMYEQGKKEVAELHGEFEEAKSKVVTPQRLEIIRMQVVEEVEKTYKERYMKQEEEIEELRTGCNKYKYELSFLKSEYEHERIECQRILEECRLKHEAEVSNLRKEREATVSKIKKETIDDSERVRIVQRENAQLHMKLKTLNGELEEIRAHREKQGFETDSLTRVQQKQITEHVATVKSLEAERESLKKQVEQLQRDLALTGDTHNKLTGRIHELEKDNVILKNKVDEAIHRNKVELTNQKMEGLKQRGELERDRDRLANIIEDLQTKIEIYKHTADQQSRSLQDKERDAVRRVQASREEEFVKYAKLESEKLALEAKLQENDRRKIDEEAHRHAEREKMEDRISSANDAKNVAEREVLVLKTKVSHQQSLNDQLERERSENSDLKNKINKLESELSSYLNNEHDMTDDNIRLRNQVELLKEETKMAKDQLRKLQDNHDLILSQQRSSYTDERTELDNRVRELHDKLSEVQKKYQKALTLYKKLRSKSHRVVENLKDKLQLTEAKYEQLDLEKKALEKCVPQENYNKLKKQWKDLHRRHAEYRKCLIGGGTVSNIPIGDMMFTSFNVTHDATFLPNYSYSEEERKHQDDLRILKQRLEMVENNQQHQIEELQEIAHSTFKGSLPGLDDHDGTLENSKEKNDIDKSS
ncbi:centrosomal protein of 83 kDa-like isoform X1 [Mytilus trossulus]|uniref:centrosomal protein of 83 kDa-like isoform X1 n=1 Tax=Mytilus trossulus TaxID=6551 RepID=UPI0030056DC9